MLHSIAVTTDFSELSRHPFGAVRDLARKFDAPLYLLHVAQGPQIYTPWQIAPESPAAVEKRQVDAQGRLEELIANEPAFAGLKVRPRALVGDSAEAIARFQQYEEIDLLVIASHGHTGMKRFLLGSFAARVLELATCPVLLYRVSGEKERKERAVFHPGRILVPHDFSQASTSALEVARSWAEEYKASARLIFVVEKLASLYGYVTGTRDSVADYLEGVRAEGQRRLEQLAATQWQGLPVEVVARVGHPAAEILKEAEEFPADLIIMASRGLSSLERLALGSVAERTVQGASCPVLVVRGKRQAGALLS